MHNLTREKFSAYQQHIAQLNGVPTSSNKFNIEPSVQQTLENRIQESSDFLKSINIIGVNEPEGEKLGLGLIGPLASTTDTSQQARATRDISTLNQQRYRCEKTNFDSHIKYSKLDAWAKFPDFQLRIRDLIIQQQALDRIMIGFNGKSHADTSNPVNNPLLQDVNKGWLQHYREQATTRVMKEGKANSGKILIGKEGDYANLDALVYDATNHMIDPWFQEDPKLIVLCGRDLLVDKYFPIINNQQAPTEQIASDLIISQQRIGNLSAIRVPYFPKGTLMITRLDNLSIYWQEGARRRAIIDNPARDQIENYESSNDAYVVENFGAGCVVENIELQDLFKKTV